MSKEFEQRAQADKRRLRRDYMAVRLMQTFLQVNKPSTFSTDQFRRSLELVAEQAVQAADVLIAELDRSSARLDQEGTADVR